MKKTLLVLLVLIIVVGGVWYFIKDKPIACTEEAKLCSDGTAVGRTGKNCEFAECPIADNQFKDWKTYTNTRDKVTFQYPSSYTQVATQYRSDLSGSDANSYYQNYMDSTWSPISTVKIAGHTANKFSGTYCDGAGSGSCGQRVPWTTYIFIYNDHPFQVEFNGDVSSSVENKILSTFKFTE